MQTLSEEDEGREMKMTVRNIVKRGGSLAVNIPSEFARELNLKAGTPILITLDDEQLRLVIEGITSVETSGRTIKIEKEAEL